MICYQCKHDVNEPPTQHAKYYLALSAHENPYNHDITRAVLESAPPLENDLFFCDKICLRDWIIGTMPKS